MGNEAPSGLTGWGLTIFIKAESTSRTVKVNGDLSRGQASAATTKN